MATYKLAHHQAAEVLEVERTSLESVLHQLRMGVLMSDADSGEISFANDQARAILGGGVGRLHSIGYPRMFHAECGRSYSPDEWPLRRCVHIGKAVEEEFLYERDDGQLVVIGARACPIFGHNGHAVAAVMSFNTVAETTRAERRLAAVATKVDSVPETILHRIA